MSEKYASWVTLRPQWDRYRWGTAKVRLLNIKTTWLEFQKRSQTAPDSKYTLWLFWIPFCAGIENPFEPHIPTGITDHVTWNFHSFARGHTINILLIWPTERLIWKEREKTGMNIFHEIQNISQWNCKKYIRLGSPINNHVLYKKYRPHQHAHQQNSNLHAQVSSSSIRAYWFLFYCALEAPI